MRDVREKDIVAFEKQAIGRTNKKDLKKF